MLIGNIYELKAQISFKAGDYELAKKDLQTASYFQVDNRGLSGLYLEKWVAVINAFSASTRNQGIHSLKDVLKKARKLSIGRPHENVTTFYRRLRGMNILKKVYFGTPLPGYRTRMLPTLRPLSWQNLLFFTCKIVFGSAARLDLKSGLIDGRSVGFNAGSLLHKVLQSLCEDLYRPVPWPPYFQMCFPMSISIHLVLTSSPLPSGAGSWRIGGQQCSHQN
ncbi:MAG: hypothetical protein R2827_15085 [Bdellovibrionales bacterium]